MDWHPIEAINRFLNNRAIAKIKEHYKYDLADYAKRHKYDAGGEFLWMLPGLVIYFVLVYAALYFNNLYLFVAAEVSIVSVLLLPMLAGKIEELRLSKKLVLSLKVWPDNSEAKADMPILLTGVEFSNEPLSNPEDLKKYLAKKRLTFYQKIHLKRKWALLAPDLQDDPTKVLEKPRKNDLKRAIEKAREDDCLIYIMTSRGDDIPTLIAFPGEPEVCLKAVQEKVKLKNGWTDMKHATLYVNEAKPVKTSVFEKSHIIDVEFPLFVSYFNKLVAKQMRDTGEWYAPTRAVQEFATFAKQHHDNIRNEPHFETLEREKNDMVKSRNSLLALKHINEVDSDLRGDIQKKLTGKRLSGTEKVQYALMGGFVTGMLIFIVGSIFGWFTF